MLSMHIIKTKEKLKGEIEKTEKKHSTFGDTQ